MVHHEIKMKTILLVVWFSVCSMKPNLASPAADWDDALFTSREPVFRKDYTLDEQKQGWYKVHRVPDYWTMAAERCYLEGAVIASPLNVQIHSSMLSNMKGVSAVLTGINSIFSYGDYYSIGGVPLFEMPVNWTNGLPDLDRDNVCVTLFTIGTIGNVNCHTTALPYICYKDNNYTPLTECGTIDPEYTFNSELDTCYKLHTEKRNWQDAFKTCSAEGGHLVVLNSDKEFRAVVQLFNKDPNAENVLDYKVLVGIVNWQPIDQWYTIHGEKLEKSGFSSWDPIYHGSNYCGALTRTGFSRVLCKQELRAFVCEKKPDSLITPYQLYEITHPLINI